MATLSFSLRNARKNYEGMLDNFARGSLSAHRAREEAALEAWIAGKKKRTKTFGPMVTELRTLIAGELDHYRRDRLVRLGSYLPQVLASTRTAYRLAVEREKPDADRRAGFQDRDVEGLGHQFQAIQRTMYAPTERAMLGTVLQHMAALPEGERAEPFDAFVEQAGGIDAALDTLFNAKVLTGLKARMALLEADRADLEASNNPWIRLAVAIERWEDEQREADDAYLGAMTRLRPKFIEALVAARGGRPYADANASLRLTFGGVEGYAPAEAVSYGPQTTVRGMAAKAGEAPFALSDEMLIAARHAGEDGKWTDDALGSVPMCFLATLENTGGNSGSPTFNAQGEIIGLAFDRNYEGMAADWLFDPDRTRSIHVDMRFVAWMLSRDAAAGWLMGELGIESGG
jgi:hypothetical protein